MEDIKKLLEQNEADSTCTSDENDSDSESCVWNSRIIKDFSFASNNFLEQKCSYAITSKKRNGEKRLPTRRPDPNVYNRNALLARENRRKKKAYLETIEKELQVARKVNRALSKALKRQVKRSQSLEKEKRYFESLVKNKSDILTLVNALNFRHIPESDKSCFSARSNHEDYLHNDIQEINARSLKRSDALSIEFDSRSDGSASAPIGSSFSNFSSSWDDIWGDRDYDINNLVSTNSTISQNNEMHSFINDHCYVAASASSSIDTHEQRSESSDYIDVEESCAHIGEFSSNSNWSHACGTPPLQLLSE